MYNESTYFKFELYTILCRIDKFIWRKQSANILAAVFYFVEAKYFRVHNSPNSANL